MAMEISFPGGKRVDAEYNGRTIRTDQSESEGGGGTAPEPFDLFLASLATCAGYYVLDFCASRGIPTDRIKLLQSWERDPQNRLITQIKQEIILPDGFPTKYEKAIVRAAALCSVKKHLVQAPEISIEAHRVSAKSTE